MTETPGEGASELDRFGQERDPDEEHFGRIRQEEYARGTPTHETLKNAPSPDLVLAAVTEILEDFEDLEKAEAYDRYALKPYYQTAGERARALSKTLSELEERKIIEKVTDKEGEQVTYEDGTPKYITNVAGYSIENRTLEVTKTREQTVEEVEVLKVEEPDGEGEKGGEETGVGEVKEKKGKTKKTIRTTTERSREEVPYYGTEEERRLMAEAYRAAERTLIVREKLHNLYAFAYLPHTANLSGLVENFFIKFPKFSNDQINNLFNLPDFKNFNENPNNTELGKRIDLAMRLLLVVARSEKKDKILKLMKTPGYKDILLPALAGKEKEDQKQWEEEWIGTPQGKFEKEFEEEGGGWAEDEDRDNETYEKEREKGRRGVLTSWGNVFARGEMDQEILVKLIGEAVGDDTAADLAFRFFKISGLASEEGIERFGEGAVSPKLAKKAAEGEISEDEIRSLKGRLMLAGDPDTDDLTKLMHFRAYREKELIREDGGRVAGPEESLDSIDKLTLSLFRVATTKTEHGTRSMMEQWWGYPGSEVLPREDAKRLGELNWDIDMDSDLREAIGSDPDLRGISKEGIWGVYSLFLFLAGRSDPVKGIYSFMYAEDFDPGDFIKRDFWRHKNKFISIVVNSNLLAAKGDFVSEFEKVIKENREIGWDEAEDKVKGVLKERRIRSATSVKKGFWKGVRALPQWEAMWESMKLKPRTGVARFLTVRADNMAEKYGYKD